MDSTVWDRASLNKTIHTTHSCLCVGLDTDQSKLPSAFQNSIDGIFKFNQAIIDVTLPYAVSYKLNAAFYEVLGMDGWAILRNTIDYIRSKHKFVIIDAKRGDIGNTGQMYASACFEYLKADAATVSPYMGKDSVDPFLKFEHKWTILLALTSNAGAEDFQLKKLQSDRYLFEEVLIQAKTWGNQNQLMFVTGATKTDYLERIRLIIPDYFLLVPGVGAQGGDLSAVLQLTLSTEGDVILNASRSILYASSGLDFAQAAEKEAKSMQKLMSTFI